MKIKNDVEHEIESASPTPPFSRSKLYFGVLLLLSLMVCSFVVGVNAAYKYGCLNRIGKSRTFYSRGDIESKLIGYSFSIHRQSQLTDSDRDLTPSTLKFMKQGKLLLVSENYSVQYFDNGPIVAILMPLKRSSRLRPVIMCSSGKCRFKQ